MKKKRRRQPPPAAPVQRAEVAPPESLERRRKYYGAIALVLVVPHLFVGYWLIGVFLAGMVALFYELSKWHRWAASLPFLLYAILALAGAPHGNDVMWWQRSAWAALLVFLRPLDALQADLYTTLWIGAVLALLLSLALAWADRASMKDPHQERPNKGQRHASP